MPFSEDEAMEKWCPFARVPLYEKGSLKALVSVNRIFTEDEDGEGMFRIHCGARCIAAECMAWQRSGNDSGYCGLIGDKIWTRAR